jgi:hypothetical protein
MIKIIKNLLIVIFITIIVAEAYMVFINYLNFGHSHMLLILIMIFLLLFRSNLTWGILFVICIYGVFDFFDSTHKSVPTFMDFTAALNWCFFNGGTGVIFHRILKTYPLFFYLGTSIILTINYFKEYNIKA